MTDSNATDRRAGNWDTTAAGFGIAWAVLLVSGVASVIIGAILDETGMHGNEVLFLGLISPFAMLGLIAASYFSGHKRFAGGVLAGFGSMFALTLLLVAACFGLFAVNGF
ncbi:MAG: hypothetical protein R3F22_08280 [Lysobacteraceae bacterium]